MPCLKIKTNAAVPNELLKPLVNDASALAAELLGKPENYVMAMVEPDVALTFAGSDAPAAYVELKSIGLPEQETAQLSQSLCQFINDKLGIPINRIFIEFANAERHLWGWDGRTF